MDSILKEVKSTTYSADSSESDKTFVIREITKERRQSPSESRIVEVLPAPAAPISITSHHDALQILQNEPDIDSLLTTIRWLNSSKGHQALDLKLPGPTQARLIHILTESILPSCWHVVDESSQKALAECLTSIAGLKALVAALRRLLSQRTNTGSTDRTIIDLLEVLAAILQPHDIFSKLWSGLSALSSDQAKLGLTWKEVTNFFGSHVLDGIQNEALSKLDRTKVPRIEAVTSADWFAANVLHLTFAEGGTQAASKLFARSFDPNHAQQVSVLIIARQCLVAGDGKHDNGVLSALIERLSRSEKRRCMETLLACLSKGHGMDSFSSESEIQSQAIPGMAGLLHSLIAADDELRQELAKLMTDMNHASKSSLTARRAAILALAHAYPNELPQILTKATSTFGDQLFIDHAPAPRQEAIAHTIIVSTSHLCRKQHTLVTAAIRSSGFMQGISNRLATSNPRARWLGMIVGMAVSRLVDKPDTQMNFHVSDVQTPEAGQWLNLINVGNQLGDKEAVVAALDSILKPRPGTDRKSRARKTPDDLPLINGKRSFGPPRPPTMVQREVQGDKITELADDASDSEGDLKPYAKPDSDPEDSDEDATLVNRNKARPPVYIRSLMSMLRENENAERFQLAIKHAAPLIRRKTGFGREVSDHAEELARILSNLQDPFDTDDFDDLRLQALIALLLSDLPIVGPWLSRQAFAKDYSTAQRSIMLTALGLGGRELAGYKHEDELNRGFDNASFPSKQLPANLRAIYDSPDRSRLLDMATQNVEQAMIQPLALNAADQSTSNLDAVKVRKFSSRLDAARTKRKPTANGLAKVFRKAIFHPLLMSFQQEVAVFGDTSVYISTPILLTTFLKTLAILLHASGPATLDLAQITTEFWEMLLHLRVRATSDIAIMEAVLFALLTLLEVNDNKHDLAQNSPRQLMETKEWVEMIFDRTGGGNIVEGEGDQARTRTLCAGVLTKAGEIISAYQNILLGSWSGM